MRVFLNPFYILSGARSGDTPAQAESRTRSLRIELDALGYATAECRGAYKGITEPSVLVLDPTPGNDNAERDVLGLAHKYRQESVLAVDGTRHGSLVYVADGKRVPLGAFRAVSRHTALASDAYTERAGNYYVCGY